MFLIKLIYIFVELTFYQKNKMKKLKLFAAEFLAMYKAGHRNFRNADMRGVNLSIRKFKDCDFTGADLSNSDLSQTSFKNCCFENANLSGCTFAFSTFSNVVFTEADTTAVCWLNVIDL